MAVLRIPDEDRKLTNAGEITQYLAGVGIQYEQVQAAPGVPAEASTEEILAAYEGTIAELKRQGGYVTADVVDVTPRTQGLDAMLAKFNREHWHDEDEVRLILAGRGLFHIHPPNAPVIAIEVEAGDLIRVPKGTWHWFDLCAERRIRAIRLFQDPSGWTPHYTESGAEKGYQPVCFGPAYVPPATAAN